MDKYPQKPPAFDPCDDEAEHQARLDAQKFHMSVQVAFQLLCILMFLLSAVLLWDGYAQATNKVYHIPDKFFDLMTLAVGSALSVLTIHGVISVKDIINKTKRH